MNNKEFLVMVSDLARDAKLTYGFYDLRLGLHHYHFWVGNDLIAKGRLPTDRPSCWKYRPDDDDGDYSISFGTGVDGDKHYCKFLKYDAYKSITIRENNKKENVFND